MRKVIFREMHNLLKPTLLDIYKLMSCFRHCIPQASTCYSYYLLKLWKWKEGHEEAAMAGALGVEEVQRLPAILRYPSELGQRVCSMAVSRPGNPDMSLFRRNLKVWVMLVASDHQAENQESYFPTSSSCTSLLHRWGGGDAHFHGYILPGAFWSCPFYLFHHGPSSTYNLAHNLHDERDIDQQQCVFLIQL